MKTQVKSETVKPIVLNYEQTFDFDGKQVTVKANPNRHIYWCSHWEVIDALFKSGAIHRTFSPGDMGHYDYLVKI